MAHVQGGRRPGSHTNATSAATQRHAVERARCSHKIRIGLDDEVPEPATATRSKSLLICSQLSRFTAAVGVGARSRSAASSGPSSISMYRPARFASSNWRVSSSSALSSYTISRSESEPESGAASALARPAEAASEGSYALLRGVP